MESCLLLPGFGQSMISAAEFSGTSTKRKFDAMLQSGTTVLVNYTSSDIYKDCAKRKRLDDSLLLPDEEDDMRLDEDDHLGEEEKGEITPPKTGRNGRVDEDDELIGSHFEQQEGSQTMEVSIQHIRQKMDVFTNQVSGLLEAGKSFFIEAATAFEERIVQLHRNQMDKWEKEIDALRAMDAINEDMSFRLADARATIRFVRPGPEIRASS